MPAKILTDFTQYSPEYWAAHAGHPSASNFDKLITAKGWKPSAAGAKYCLALMAEKMSTNPNFFTDRPETVHMRNGINSEPRARKWYEFTRNVTVTEVGLVIDEQDRFVCSPDGLVGDDGGLELKCPKLETHLQYLLNPQDLLDDYGPQVHGSLIVSGRAWWDLMSYSPDAPPVLLRVVPDEKTEILRKAMDSFWFLYQQTMQKVLASS